jgi:PAS domain S-box-containing protein
MEGKIEYVNPSLLALGGYSSDRDIIGKPIFSFTNPEGVERLRGEVIPALLTGETWRGEMGVRNEYGAFFPSEMVTSLITDREGNPEYLLASFIDMTAPRKAVAKLIESEHRYRRLVDSANSYIFTTFFEDGQPVRSVHNPTCLAVTGYTPGELEADSNPWSKMVPEEDRGIFRKQSSRLLAGDAPEEIKHRIKRKDGEIRWVLATIVPTYDGRGNLVSFDGLVRDITQQKLAEDKLNEYRENLEEMVDKKTAELRKTIDLMAGREVRMSRLKKTIKLLRGQIEEMGMVPVADDPLKIGSGQWAVGNDRVPNIQYPTRNIQ